MKGALVIFCAMVVIGVIVYLVDLLYYRKKSDLSDLSDLSDQSDRSDTGSTDHPSDSGNGICCGAHTVCEKTSLSPVTGEIVYFDDEELDRFAGREADDYTPEEIEEFRDVLLTLRPEEVAGWGRSIQVRGITLPSPIRDELLMIVGDLREGRQ